MATKKIPQSNFDEISLEHSHLRQEILHNGTLNSQTLAATLAIVGVLMGLAFSEHISNDTIKGTMFFLVAIIILINTLQILDRERATYVIASYIRIFIETKLPNLQWESRLKNFRQHSKEQGYGDFITSQLIIHTILTITNIILGNIYLYNGTMSSCDPSRIIYLVIEVTFANLLTFCFVALVLSRYIKYAQKHEDIHDDVWVRVQNEETQKSKQA